MLLYKIMIKALYLLLSVSVVTARNEKHSSSTGNLRKEVLPVPLVPQASLPGASETQVSPNVPPPAPVPPQPQALPTTQPTVTAPAPVSSSIIQTESERPKPTSATITVEPHKVVPPQAVPPAPPSVASSQIQTGTLTTQKAPTQPHPEVIRETHSVSDLASLLGGKTSVSVAHDGSVVNEQVSPLTALESAPKPPPVGSNSDSISIIQTSVPPAPPSQQASTPQSTVQGQQSPQPPSQPTVTHSTPGQQPTPIQQQQLDSDHSEQPPPQQPKTTETIAAAKQPTPTPVAAPTSAQQPPTPVAVPTPTQQPTANVEPQNQAQQPSTAAQTPAQQQSAPTQTPAQQPPVATPKPAEASVPVTADQPKPAVAPPQQEVVPPVQTAVPVPKAIAATQTSDVTPPPQSNAAAPTQTQQSTPAPSQQPVTSTQSQPLPVGSQTTVLTPSPIARQTTGSTPQPVASQTTGSTPPPSKQSQIPPADINNVMSAVQHLTAGKDSTVDAKHEIQSNPNLIVQPKVSPAPGQNQNVVETPPAPGQNQGLSNVQLQQVPAPIQQLNPVPQFQQQMPIQPPPTSVFQQQPLSRFTPTFINQPHSVPQQLAPSPFVGQQSQPQFVAQPIAPINGPQAVTQSFSEVQSQTQAKDMMKTIVVQSKDQSILRKSPFTTPTAPHVDFLTTKFQHGFVKNQGHKGRMDLSLVSLPNTGTLEAPRAAANTNWPRENVTACNETNSIVSLPGEDSFTTKMIANYSENETAFAVFEEVDARRLWVHCYERGHPNSDNGTAGDSGVAIRNIVVTEFNDNYFGLSGRKTSGSYHTDINSNQNSYGQLNLIIINLNGKTISRGYGSSDYSLPQISEIKPKPETVTCRNSENQRQYVFGNKMEIIQESLNSGLVMKSYMFKNKPVFENHKASSEVTYTMSVDYDKDLAHCGMSSEFGIPVMTTGGITFDIMMQQQAWVDEDGL